MDNNLVDKVINGSFAVLIAIVAFWATLLSAYGILTLLMKIING